LMDTSPAAAFSLSGLNESKENKNVIFAFSIQGYIFTLFLNLTIITTISLEKDLHQPMYIFLCNLCINGLYGTLGFYPKFLYDLLSDSQNFSYIGCLLQNFVILSYALCEFTNLTVMAFDRYVAICRPLHYHTIMTPVTAGKLLVFIWMVPCCSVVCSILLIVRLPFCGIHINAVYCKFVICSVIGCIYLSMATFVVYSYGKLISACRKSKEKQSKFMQTCLPHLISCMNYLFFSFLDAFSVKNIPQWFNSFTSVAFLIVPPIINPLIYGINLKFIRTRIFKCSKGG
uniref:G-protein coupled receptors family 1 profile domain-containing protein n=1 Tax=Paramormyrops kingsleyae TaxID=1676925 RepID=A0A3B3R2K8_9TELE